MPAKIVAIHTPARFNSGVRQAAALLRAGELVAVPTETVYGLAANALDTRAVEKIFAVKNRPAHNPIIVHIASLKMARSCARRWPAMANRLAAAFWPGPLTIVLPRSDIIPDSVTAGGATVGLRWPKHPFTQALIRECGFPLAAPSANLSNRVSPTTADHVYKDLSNRIRLIVDGGLCAVGIESTVLDLSTTPPRILRPGMIHRESLEAVIGRLGSAPRAQEHEAGLRSPGRLRRHYAPRAKMAILKWEDNNDLKSQISNLNFDPLNTHVLTHTRCPSVKDYARVSVVARDPDAFGRALYAELHGCDAAGADLIVVEAPPRSPKWRAISDRLRRGSVA